MAGSLSVLGLLVIAMVGPDAYYLQKDGSGFIFGFLSALVGLLGWRILKRDTWAQFLFLGLFALCLYGGILGWLEEFRGDLQTLPDGRGGSLKDAAGNVVLGYHTRNPGKVALFGAMLLGLIASWVGLWVTRRHRPSRQSSDPTA